MSERTASPTDVSVSRLSCRTVSRAVSPRLCMFPCMNAPKPTLLVLMMSIEMTADVHNFALLFHFGTRVRQNVTTSAQDFDCVGHMTQRRMELLQVRLGECHGKCGLGSLPATASSCADSAIRKNYGPRHIGGPFPIWPMFGEPKQRALQAADIDVGALLQCAELLAVVQRAGRDGGERNALDLPIPARDLEKLFDA